MRILVCGGRDFRAWGLLWKTLDDILDQWDGLEIIHGDAVGADQGADIWCWFNEILSTRYPADWEKHGKAAGPIRNKQMLEVLLSAKTKMEAVLVIAFPGGKGTANMVKLAREANIEVREIT